MLHDIEHALACPHCGGALESDDRVLRCASGHSFDVAREGYVSLLTGGGGASTADTPAMVRARCTFLDAGHFAPIARAVAASAAEVLTDDVAGIVLDAGAGTGYVLGALLDAFPSRDGVALDISKHAARVAARSHDRLGAIVADVWKRLPLQDGCASLVVSVFSPRNADEFARVLAPGGALIVVTPRDNHLAELVGPLHLITVDPDKTERLSTKLSGEFTRVSESPVTYEITLSHAEQVAAAQMGPSAAHLSADEIAYRVANQADPTAVTVSVNVGTYRRRGDPSE